MNLAVKVTSTLLLLTIASTTSPQSEPLGRLFFTPDQRAVLDRQRQMNQASPVTDGAPIIINGRVTRSSGRNTEWINGVPLDQQEARTLMPAPVRPGQTVLGPARGKQTEVLNGGTIQIHRSGITPANH